MNHPARPINKMMIIVPLLFICSCTNFKNRITGVKISFPGEDVVKAQLEYSTGEDMSTCVKYWIKGQEVSPLVSQISGPQRNHRIFLPDLQPGQQYGFHVLSSDSKQTKLSGDYFFRTIEYSRENVDTFRVVRSSTTALPAVFEQGYILVYRREDPGTLFLFDTKGNIVWHHQLKDAGFKVVHFSKDQTFLALIGTKGYETGYGNAILELSLKGDTLLYLKKGQNDFTQTIHHEILLNPKNEIVTLCNEERIYDLRSIGGLEKDTVKGDGILVLDRQGRKAWKWTIFDALDPIRDETILKSKKDWMHANSISFDKDGNYLVSFYNNGQIWKIDAGTGNVIWKLGRNGDFKIPAWASFDEAHAVHVNNQGCIMFFDNGSKNHLSKSLAFRLDETAKIAYPVINTRLPPQLFNDRMGSSYLVSDALLHCISKHKTVALTNFQGEFLWELKGNKLMSYRAEFIAKEKLDPYMIN